MANHHFAKLADVWKHLPLVAILAEERPARYWESHAGNASYQIVEDPERRFGAIGFSERAADVPVLSTSRYLRHLRTLNGGDRLRTYPGSPLFAMAELGNTANSYVFCDLDPRSVADLRDWADRLRLSDRVTVLEADGMGSLREALEGVDAPEVLAHIDPFDPWMPGPAGLSALDLAGEVADRGGRLVYWYGYDQPSRRGWARQAIGTRTSRPLWCGDVMVTTAVDSAVDEDGDLGVATTPGTGFGLVCANLTTPALAACDELGRALAAAYHGGPLPDGTPGTLDFQTI